MNGRPMRTTPRQLGAGMAQLNAQLLAELLDRHGATLSLYARQWCLAPDDVVQQAFIDLAACHTLPEKPAAWLFAAVRRRAISKARSERRRQRHETEAGQRWFVQSRRQHEATALAIEELAELPLEDREVVIAHLWGRLTFDEIGKLIGASSSTAQRRYEAAIARLREKMTERTNTTCPKSTN